MKNWLVLEGDQEVHALQSLHQELVFAMPQEMRRYFGPIVILMAQIAQGIGVATVVVQQVGIASVAN